MAERLSLHDVQKNSQELSAGLKIDSNSLESIQIGLYQLAALSYRNEPQYGLDKPPEYLFHIAQVDRVMRGLLVNQPEGVQAHGRKLANTHDIGRAVDLGNYHPLAGALILQRLGMDNRVVHAALSHHRWGFGEKQLANGNLPKEAEVALEMGTVPVLLDTILAKSGIECLALQLADTSKLTPPGSFEPRIAQFDQSLGRQLIDIQLARGRYLPGSDTHRIEELGVRFLSAAVPYLEEKLSISYPEVITQAQAHWSQDRQDVVTLWNAIAFPQLAMQTQHA